jgi:hypothetical protein
MVTPLVFSGRSINISTVNSDMKKPLLIIPLTGLWIIYLILPLAAENNGIPIGSVIGLSGGKATVERDGVEKELSFKDPLFPGDKVRTDPNVRLRILIQGSNVLTLKELTEVHLRMDAATPAQPKNKFTVKFLSGSGRFVVDKGKLQQNQYDVEGGNAVAAIKGSDLITQIGPTGATFFTGPGATATVFHRGPLAEPRDLGELQKASISAGVITDTPIVEPVYRELAGTIATSGAQNPNHRGADMQPIVDHTVASVANETLKTVSNRMVGAVAPLLPSGPDNSPLALARDINLAPVSVELAAETINSTPIRRPGRHRDNVSGANGSSTKSGLTLKATALAKTATPGMPKANSNLPLAKR